MVFMLGILIQKPVNAIEYTEFEVIKGVVVDSDGDGVWDSLTFAVKTKNGKIEIPVIKITINNGKSVKSEEVFYELNQVNKRLDEYTVSLSDLGIRSNFSIEIELDIGAILSDADVIDAGPGPNPNPTIIIIDYP